MLTKHPNRERFYLKWIKGIILVEGVLFLSSYYLWSKLNSSRDFRYYVHNKCPFILDQFYNLTRAANPHCKIELQDKQVWSGQENSH